MYDQLGTKGRHDLLTIHGLDRQMGLFEMRPYPGFGERAELNHVYRNSSSDDPAESE